MPPCRLWEVTNAARCSSLAWEPVLGPPSSWMASSSRWSWGTCLTRRPPSRTMSGFGDWRSMARKALKSHCKKIRELHLRKLFAADPKRGVHMTAEAAGFFLDYSKNRITDETLKLLFALAKESGLRAAIDAMFRGDKINLTENRAVLHVALRAPKRASLTVDGKNVVPEVHAVLDKMAEFSKRIRSGAWKGHTGKRIHNIVNVG